MSIAPTADERTALLALLDECRDRGATRFTYGALSLDFAGPKSDPADRQLPTEPLNRAERDRLSELEQKYQFDEELGHG